MYLALRSFSSVKLKEKFLFFNSSSSALTCSTVRCKSYSRSPDGQSLAAFLYSISFCVPLWSRLMWGSALVTVWNTILSLSSSLHLSSAHLSLSSWITSLKTPWAAGCWGPNLSWNYIVDVQYLTTLLFTCKLLRLGQPASVGHQLGFVLLLGEEEVLLFVLASVISQDGLWNVDVLPPGGLHVH